MVTLTQNIPRPNEFPSFIEEHQKAPLIEWMSKLPDADIDHCMNRQIRWIYEVQDTGLCYFVRVKDSITKESINLEPDMTNL